MKEKYIPPFVTLLAAAITSIINIVKHIEAVPALKRLLVVIIIFYFIGIIVKVVIHKGLKIFEKKENTEEDNEHQENEEETETEET